MNRRGYATRCVVPIPDPEWAPVGGIVAHRPTYGLPVARLPKIARRLKAMAEGRR